MPFLSTVLCELIGTAKVARFFHLFSFQNKCLLKCIVTPGASRDVELRADIVNGDTEDKIVLKILHVKNMVKVSYIITLNYPVGSI